MFRSHKNPSLSQELPSLDPSTYNNNQQDVLETIDTLEIPRERLIVVGSGVLTLLGLSRRAHDVDIILHPDDLRRAHTNESLPNGIAVTYTPSLRPGQLHLTADTSPLPVEFLSHESPLDKSRFKDFIETRTIISPSGVRVLSPTELQRRKEKSIRVSTTVPGEHLVKIAQDRRDAQLLSDWREQQRLARPE